MRTIAVANQKGGCGKTTTAINLAVALAHRGKRVLVVDLDPQACMTSALDGEPDAARASMYHLLVSGRAPMSEIIKPTGVERLDLAPSNVSLAAAEIELIGEVGRELRLALAFRTVRDRYDFCIMDCPPSLGALTLNALVASTDVLVPVQVDSYALDCTRRLLETVEIIRRRFHRASAGNLRILLTCVDDRIVLGRRVQQQMRELFGDLVLETVIHRTAMLPEALAAGKAVLTYAPTSAGASEYVQLAEELLGGEPQSLADAALQQAAQVAGQAVAARKLAAAEASAAPAPVAETPAAKRPVRVSRPAVTRKSRRAVEPAPTVQPPLAVIEPAPDDDQPQYEPLTPRPTHRRIGLLMALLLLLGAAVVVAVMFVQINRPPMAQPVHLTTQEDTPLSISLTASDWNRDALTYKIGAAPTHARLSGAAPNVVYTPAPNYNGLDRFTFTASDGTSESMVAGVTITITPVNDPPVAASQTVTVEDNKSLAIDLFGRDADGEPVVFALLDRPRHGTVTFDAEAVADGKLVYTPEPGFIGPDSLTYRVSDHVADSAPAKVSINVMHVNAAPTAGPLSLATKEDAPLPIALTATDPESDPLTYRVLEKPAHGSLSGTPPQMVYTPEQDYHGSDQFAFVANDGKTDSQPSMVTISIEAVNDPPAAIAQEATVQDSETLTLSLSGRDADSDELRFRLAELPSHGTLDLDARFVADGKLVYKPQPGFLGPDSFTFTTTDGLTDSIPAVVALNVIHVNAPPEVNNVTLSTAEDTPLSVILSARDPEGSPLTYTVTAGPSHGSLVGAGQRLEYVPKAEYSGPDGFTYLAGDPDGGRTTGTVAITVTPVGDPPAITTEPPTIAAVGRAFTYDVNTVDPDPGSKLTYSLVDKPAGMTIDPAGGLIRWTPTNDQMGNHEVTVQVADNSTPPLVTTQVLRLSVETPSPQKMILAAAGGYDQKNGQALTVEEDIRRVQNADGECWPTAAGRYTVYSFAKAPIPSGAVIVSAVIYVDHYEDAQFPTGKLDWKIGSGWPGSGTAWMSLSPSVYEGLRNKGALAWDVTSTVNTPEKINALQVQINNKCTTGAKTTFVDQVYLQVRWQ